MSNDVGASVDQPISVIAPAKLNLFLHITGRRDDGLHLLESLFVFTKQGDRIILKPADDISLEIIGPFAAQLGGNMADNLVMKAARDLAKSAAINKGAHITLVKNLPVASGIGGGSADAAATLNGLCALWGLSLSGEALAALALKLGADVSACLSGTPKFVRGIGDVISATEIPSAMGVVLVNAGTALATADVFRAFRENKAPFSAKTHKFEATSLADLPLLLNQTNNCLEEHAVHLVPEIAQVLQALENAAGCQLVRMSGSGATCFALFAGLEEAQNAAKEIQRTQPKWWVKADELQAI